MTRFTKLLEIDDYHLVNTDTVKNIRRIDDEYIAVNYLDGTNQHIVIDPDFMEEIWDEIKSRVVFK